MLKEVKAGAELAPRGQGGGAQPGLCHFQHKMLSDDVQKAWMDELAMF